MKRYFFLKGNAMTQFEVMIGLNLKVVMMILLGLLWDFTNAPSENHLSFRSCHRCPNKAWQNRSLTWRWCSGRCEDGQG